MSGGPGVQPALAECSAVVTGAARGIGRAIVDALTAEGAFVVAVDLDPAAPDGAYPVRPQLVLPVVGDAADGELAAEAVRRAEAQRPLQVLVNNAATGGWGSLHDLDRPAWDETFSRTLDPCVTFLHAALPTLMAHGSGSVVNVASINQRVAFPGLAAYTAAKGAVVALTRQAAVEYGPYGIRCNAVSPGYVVTERTAGPLAVDGERRGISDATPLRRIGTPEDVAAAVAFLAHPSSSFISGIELPVDGAASVQNAAGVLRPSFRRRARLG